VTEHNWWHQATCRDADPDLFAYDPSSDPAATADAAKAVCAGCPVTGDCLDFAFHTMRASQDLTGIYGGLTPDERATRRPPERPRPWRRHDPDFAARSFAKASELGTNAAAGFYQVDPKTLRAAWDHHGLGRPQPRPPATPPAAAKLDRETAQQAFALARQHSIAEAARRFGMSRRGLRLAWDRYQLGHPHQGIPGPSCGPAGTASTGGAAMSASDGFRPPPSAASASSSASSHPDNPLGPRRTGCLHRADDAPASRGRTVTRSGNDDR
jgi:WhiB family transcriptional regulator, redox-sensing transcriptional regulator